MCVSHGRRCYMKRIWTLKDLCCDIALSTDLWTSVCISLMRVSNKHINLVNVSLGQDRQCRPLCHTTQVLKVFKIGILSGEVKCHNQLHLRQLLHGKCVIGRSGNMS